MTKPDREGGEIAVFFTGGTISMAPTEEGRAVTSALGLEDLLNQLPTPPEGVTLRKLPWSNLPSAHMSTGDTFRLVSDIMETLQDDSILGAVAIHGTDIMEEAAFMAYIMLETPKPVVFTGSMRHHGELGYEGLRNLTFSIKACACPDAAGRGVMIIMGDRILSARDAVKVHSLEPAAFDSPGAGPIGFVSGDKIRFLRQVPPGPTLRPAAPRVGVHLIKLASGMDGELVQACLDRGASGLVVEAFGAGNVPPPLTDILTSAVTDGIPVVLTSRCLAGGVSPIYGYPGGAVELSNRGIILGGTLSGPKARILLMLALGETTDTDRIRAFFERF